MRTALVASLAVGGPPAVARAESPGVAARAAALSNEARALRDGGRLSDACARFAQAKTLKAGVDVSLDLADCYERLGRTTSAWTEFASAEKLAREQNDGRAAAAHARLEALKPHLSRVTIAVAPETAAASSEVVLDKQPVFPAMYGAALAVDPGDHVLGVVPKEGPVRTLRIHVDPSAALTVHAEDARPAPTPAVEAPPAPAPADPADTLFAEGKALRASGELAKACAKFAQSQALAPGIGVTLHLADCYERLGRTASAWIEFAIAEKTAHDQHDAREATARARALILEPRLDRVTIAVRASTPREGPIVQLDGRTVPSSMWNVAMATDPGDHLVTFEGPGAERRTFPVHLDATASTVVVPVDAAAAAADSVAPSAAAPAAALAPLADVPGGGDRGASTRPWVEVGLLGGGVLAAGVGGALLVVKNNSMSNTAAGGRPYVDPVAAAASKIAFGTAGACGLAAVVLYLTAPHPKDAGLYVGPAPTVGGGGAVFGGAF